MKRMSILVLALMLACTVMLGCSAKEIAEVTEPGPVTVSNVDELLAAIAPGAEVVMGEGLYVLSEAKDYGDAPEGGYYSWEYQEDGYQLVIHSVQNLTIQGCGRETTILETDPRYARILVLDGCTDVRLENLSIGRSDRKEYLSGLELKYCTDVTMRELGVFGCGTMGMSLSDCKNIMISDSEISGCNFLAVGAETTNGLVIENCTFRELGNAQYGGGCILKLNQTKNVTVSGCKITNNLVSCLVDCYPCENVVFESNIFMENQVRKAVFDVDGGLIFDNNIFDNNNIANWFTAERSTVLDKIGKSWNAEMLQWYYQPPVETAPDGSRTEVRVTNADQFLAAIGPNTEIILDAECIDLSTAKDYGTGYSNYYYWSEEFDGPSLIISDVDNLLIRSESGNVKDCTLSAVPRYANVLSFRRCSNVSLSGFTAGHTVEPGYCMGGVLYFRDCDNVLVDNCGLYGCGILGVQADLCGGITVKNCDIYECSYGGIQMGEVMGVVIENCKFRDLGGDSMSFYDCKEVTVDGKSIAGNARIA